MSLLGLAWRVVKAMRTYESITTMHDLDLAIHAAISIEAKLNTHFVDRLWWWHEQCKGSA